MRMDLEAAYIEHSKHLVNYANQLLKNKQDAEDAVQDVFCRVAAKGQQMTNPEAFLFVATRRECYDALRKKALHAKRMYTGSDVEEMTEQVPSSDPTQVVDDRDELEHVLARLSLRQRQSVLLKAAGYRGDEIAQALGISPESVRRYQWDARRKVNTYQR